MRMVFAAHATINMSVAEVTALVTNPLGTFSSRSTHSFLEIVLDRIRFCCRVLYRGRGRLVVADM